MKNLFFGIENVSFFDPPWPLIHLTSGLGLGLLLTVLAFRFLELIRKYYFILGILAIFTWEVFEMILRFLDQNYPELAQTFKIYLPNAWFAKESLLNTSGDLIFGLLGLAVVYLIFLK